MDPRIVVVRRTTEYESLLKEHGTPQMAKFKLKQMGLSLAPVTEMHNLVLDATTKVLGAVPTTWRKSWVLRESLDRFRFDPSDVILAVGWDGLVPNVAKYLKGQPVFGINPFAAKQQMMLWKPGQAGMIYSNVIPVIDQRIQNRSMAKVTLQDGRSLIAMNEIFCGHRSHQSAKYDITFGDQSEYHSSSGLIVSTGTGLTGWALSLRNAMKIAYPAYTFSPMDPKLLLLVREAWTGHGTGTTIQNGIIHEQHKLSVMSKMQDGGVLFGDGIESDSLDFNWGMTASFSVSEIPLRLVVP